ncbi:hypothetical protein BCR44DRAFT_33787 [Catenaria anguillulae PL171]|uniref:Uncharacterized protein n=1 Tax=Catenaria anguillulae PL171 TaxID=765915 RepID=A0A1Y2HN03_9FUNG|nr:hypothetical protein BCR44DRAFT_33787 [Catenaria anguillulae PL171]
MSQPNQFPAHVAGLFMPSLSPPAPPASSPAPPAYFEDGYLQIPIEDSRMQDHVSKTKKLAYKGRDAALGAAVAAFLDDIMDPAILKYAVCAAFILKHCGIQDRMFMELQDDISVLIDFYLEKQEAAAPAGH